jgi:hypothetical protein
VKSRKPKVKSWCEPANCNMNKIRLGRLLGLTAMVVVGMALSVAGQGLRAGAAMRIITPNPLLPVSGGIGKPQPAKEKTGELTVRAMVLEKNGVRVAIVGVDNLGWSSVLGNRSRALIKGIPAENIMIGATHTHSAPDAYAFPDEQGKSYADLAYLDKCTHQIADAVNEALGKLEPAVLRTVVGEAKGKISYNYYADKLFDPRCGVIQAIADSGGRKGKTIVTLVNYAVHPEVIGPDRGILGPDLCGPLYDRIEERAGGLAIFMNSAQGGMVTADNRLPDGKEANDWAECQRIGRTLADEALRLIADAPVQRNPTLYCASQKLKLPVESPIMKYILQKSPLSFPVLPGDTVATQVNLLNIGQAQVLTIPGEALPNIGYYVKRQMHTKQPFLFGLTNDAFGYMLTKVDFNSFERYSYVSRTSLGEMTAELWMNHVIKMIHDSPSADER